MMRQPLGSIARIVFLIGASCAAAPMVHAGERFPIPFKPFELHSSVDGREVTVAISGTATAADLGNALDVHADITVNLADLRAKIGPIIQARTYRDDDCNEKLRVHSVDLRAAPPIAILAAGVHYEKWACFLTAKTRLFEQNGSIRTAITPAVAGDAITARLQIVGIDADGVLGSLVGSEAFTTWLTAQFQGLFPQTLTLGRLRDALPPALKDVPATLSDLAITDAGSGTPAIRGTLRLTISADKMAAILRDLR